MGPATPSACSAGSSRATCPPTWSRETDTALAFRDINPAAPTHALVVPRSHHADAAALADAEPDTVAELVRVARDVAQADGLDEYRLVFNTGAAAGQTVFHTHLHVLGGRAMTWPPG